MLSDGDYLVLIFSKTYPVSMMQLSYFVMNTKYEDFLVNHIITYKFYE